MPIFSCVDVYKGFTNIEFDESSSFLTTMHTPVGRYRWLRMPFGVSLEPEEYQRRQYEALEGLTGVVNHTKKLPSRARHLLKVSLFDS